VGNGVRWLFKFPKILRQPGHCRGRIENDFSAIQSQRARAFGEVAVITNVNSDARKRRVEARVTQIARPKIKLLPEAGVDVRYVVLAVLAQILTVCVDDRGGVVV